MSGSNMLTAPNDDDDMNMLAGTARMASIPPAPTGPVPPLGAQRAVRAEQVANALQGNTQEQMIQKRDNAGKEMGYLARVMQNPNVTRSEVSAYLGSLASQGQISPDELVGILRTLPHQSEQIRQWAQMMFAVMMHVGIHGHAAYPASLFPGGTAVGPEEEEEQPDEGADDSEGETDNE